MLTLGTLFGTSYAMAGGSKKPQAGATPPLNASSPDEADFIKCASPEHTPLTPRGTWVRRSLTLEQEVPGQRRRQEGGEQALDWGNGPMTMQCATGLGCPVYIYHGRILGIDTISPCLQPCFPHGACSSDAGNFSFPSALCSAPFPGCFDQRPWALYGIIHSQRTSRLANHLSAQRTSPISSSTLWGEGGEPIECRCLFKEFVGTLVINPTARQPGQEQKLSREDDLVRHFIDPQTIKQKQSIMVSPVYSQGCKQQGGSPVGSKNKLSELNGTQSAVALAVLPDPPSPYPRRRTLPMRQSQMSRPASHPLC
jgi:hypothetical protein